MKKSLKKKYMTLGIILIVSFLLAMFTISYLIRNPLMSYWNRIQMEKIGEAIYKENYEIMEREELENIIEEQAYEKGTYITMTDKELNVKISSMIRTERKGTLGSFYASVFEKYRDILEQKGRCFIGRVNESNKAEFLLIVKHNEEYLFIGKSINGINSSQFAFYIGYFISAILFLMIIIPILFYLVGKMTDPILEINKITRKIADLNFEEKILFESEDELGMLAHSVNDMSVKLKEAIEYLQRDVELRKELVRNMAHELKTPISVIMGYSENISNIIEKHPEKAEKYSRIITDECERMNQIVKQMLEISAYENAIQKKLFSGQDLLNQVRDDYDKELSAMNHKYEEKNELQNPVYGDQDVLQRALYNYVKNAVSYGKKEGKILVHAWEEDGKTWFSVFNEGDPISEADQNKIWNTFYKVDRARTRNKNSSGLGLAIVKEAVLAHEGEYGVKNVKDGVLFYFSI